MPVGLIILIAAMAVFVGFHLILSHALRGRAVDALGPGTFQLVYSAGSFLLFILILVAYHGAPRQPPLWSSDHPALQIGFSVGTIFGATLFLASLVGNPALLGASLTGLSTRPPAGVFKVTRHPMMFGIAIWLLMEIMISPDSRNAIAYGGLVVLALVGSRLQDSKKTALSGREWSLWVKRTPFWPNLRYVGEIGPVWLIGFVAWLVATLVQVRITQIPVGLWYFVPVEF